MVLWSDFDFALPCMDSYDYTDGWYDWWVLDQTEETEYPECLQTHFPKGSLRDIHEDAYIGMSVLPEHHNYDKLLTK